MSDSVQISAIGIVLNPSVTSDAGPAKEDVITETRRRTADAFGIVDVATMVRADYSSNG
jgi:hypothetical protein